MLLSEVRAVGILGVTGCQYEFRTTSLPHKYDQGPVQVEIGTDPGVLRGSKWVYILSRSGRWRDSRGWQTGHVAMRQALRILA